ncbi:MAG: hypothetical protein QW203_07490 [Thermoplasmatales archaeon]
MPRKSKGNVESAYIYGWQCSPYIKGKTTFIINGQQIKCRWLKS